MDRKRRFSREAPPMYSFSTKRVRPDLVENMMELSPDDRNYILQTHPNPMGYPQEYLDIYNRERNRRNLQGFENLKNITRDQIVERGPEQVGSTRIQRVVDPNCIKSRLSNKFDLDLIKFPQELSRKFLEMGVVILGDFHEYMDDLKTTDQEYFNEITKIDEFEKTEMAKLSGVNYNNDDDDDDSLQWDESRNKIIDIVSEEMDKVNTVFEQIAREKYESLKSHALNKFRAILAILLDAFGPYKDYICIAGGFALSMYIYENYGYFVDFSDIDLFIHSCDEYTANQITKLLSKITGTEVFQNENVVLSFFDCVESGDYIYTEGSTRISIQVIKRLYTCPQQVITGFDVDCCCILTTLDGDIFVTERGYYSIKNCYNVINFDRLSPSYEYRISKYNRRGFGIWIPYIEYFKRNAVFDANVIDYKKGSSIILTDLMKKPNRNKRSMDEISDYMEIRTSKFQKLEGDDVVQFKTLNPGEQTINTFHRIVLEDFKEWYPVRPANVVDHFVVYESGDETVNIVPTSENEYIIAMNIQRTKKQSANSIRAKETSIKMITNLSGLYPGAFFLGGIPQTIVTGESDFTLKVWDPSIYTNVQIKLFDYRVQEFRILFSMLNKIKVYYPEFDVENLHSLGKVVFTQDKHRVLEMTDEESFRNFIPRNSHLLEHFYSYGGPEKESSRANTYYVASPEAYEIFERINNILYEKKRPEIERMFVDFLNPTEETNTVYRGIIGYELVHDWTNRGGISPKTIGHFSYDEKVEFLNRKAEEIRADIIMNTRVGGFSFINYIRVKVLNPSIPLQNHIDSIDMIDSAIYHNGNFFGNKSNYEKLKTRSFNSDSNRVFDRPVWQQYIPER